MREYGRIEYPLKNVKHVKNPIDFSLNFKERVIKIFPKKKKCKKTKWLSEEALHITEERSSEEKGKIHPIYLKILN